MMGFGKSKAKFFVKGKQDVKFADVGGMKEAKQELEEIVDFLKHPDKYKKVGARTPKGVLLVGPAGTGKTLLARAVAGEAGVPYLSIAGSEFMEMLVGVGAARARDLFETAKKMSPSIIFIDEIDAIGRMRGHGGGMGGHDEREQTLNQILVEMDGFSPNDNVIVLAATNRGDMLDPALTRPGRFDRRVQLTLPDIEERVRILKIHAENKPVNEEVNWQSIGKRTVGFSGADLENMLNEAAILIARENRKEITNKDLEEAALKVKLGPSKKRLQSELERRMTAYHEAGHAVVAHFLPDADRVHRISIVSRGQALGFTLTPPEQDKYQQTRSEMMASMSVLLGGRAAEDIFFGELTGGASSDIERVTAIARAMVMDYGMSKLGPLNYGPQYDMNSYVRAVAEPYQISDKLQAQVDAELQRLAAEAEATTRAIITKHRKVMDKIVEQLLEVETLEADEFEAVVGKKKVTRDVDGTVKTE
jgi:cell division protease FtsH